MRVLISVSDKTGIVDFSRSLKQLGCDIISTGGTARLLSEHDVDVIAIDDVTHFPEMLDGRVKTLHPKIHGGLLARRDLKDHMDTCKEHGIELIDLVVVNLYPFESTIAKADVSVPEAIENIDIGGPSMIRSAAKNYAAVGVVVSPGRYSRVIQELKDNSGQLTSSFKEELAAEAFSHTAYYDSIIAQYFNQTVLETTDHFSESLAKGYTKETGLRYGENPHQAAAVYRDSSQQSRYAFNQLQGKALSYNNYIDLDAAYELVKEFELPAAVVIKHTNPCGVAVSDLISSAYQSAHDADPLSAFGSIVGLNRAVDESTARSVSQTFVEAIIAPSFDSGALEILKEKKNLRLITVSFNGNTQPAKLIRPVFDRLLVQDANEATVDQDKLKVVTKSQPTSHLMNDLHFAYTVVKHVKSNAIVLAKDGVIVGVGAGQMSRVKSVEIAIEKAGELAKGAVLASDAFFPFSDSVDLAAKAGVSSIIQPGGSKRDSDSIQACDQHGLSMVFTGLRHFKH